MPATISAVLTFEEFLSTPDGEGWTALVGVDELFVGLVDIDGKFFVEVIKIELLESEDAVFVKFSRVEEMLRREAGTIVTSGTERLDA